MDSSVVTCGTPAALRGKNLCGSDTGLMGWFRNKTKKKKKKKWKLFQCRAARWCRGSTAASQNKGCGLALSTWNLHLTLHSQRIPVSFCRPRKKTLGWLKFLCVRVVCAFHGYDIMTKFYFVFELFYCLNKDTKYHIFNFPWLLERLIRPFLKNIWLKIK